MSQTKQTALLERLYQNYLIEQDSAAFIRQVAGNYTIGTLERLTTAPLRELRRGAVLALGFLGNYESNSVMGRALSDKDRGVRIAAESGIVSLWCRGGNEEQRQLLSIVIRLNSAKQFEQAMHQAGELIERISSFAEAWNQRAIANYSMGKFEEAILDYQQTLEFNPYHFGAAAGMGQCHAKGGGYRFALECFRRALKLNPNLEGVRANVLHLQRALDRD